MKPRRATMSSPALAALALALTLAALLPRSAHAAQPVAEAGEVNGSTPAELLGRAESLLDRANEAARVDLEAAHALEAQAAAIYRGLIEHHGIDTAAVHRNLGVVELRRGELGRAIASLKRAEAIDPADPQVLETLAAARGRVRTAVPISIRERTASALLFWRSLVPRPAMLWAGLVLWAIGWGLLALRVAGRGAWARALSVPCFALAVLAIGSLAAEGLLSGRGRGAVVIAPEVVARKGPSEFVFDPAFDQPLRAGTEGVIIERRAGWLRVRLASGSECWIPGTAAEEV